MDLKESTSISSGSLLPDALSAGYGRALAGVAQFRREQTYNYARPPRVITEQLVPLPKLGPRPNAVAPGQWIVSVIDQINQVSKARRFALLELVLKQTDVTTLDPVVLVTILRTTFPVRNLLPSWNQFLQRARSELEHRGLNVLQLLRGLA